MVWLWENLDLVLGLALDHARLSIIPIVVSLIAAVPLGWLATRHPLARSIILVISGAAFTIPSLALFIVLPAVLGTRILDELNVIVALSIYGVAVMARGAADAFASVPRDVINSSTAVGYSRIGRFWAVELPLAGPVILERGAKIAQVGHHREILANPASDFVADFIGAQRGKRRLTASAASGDDVLLVDGTGYAAGVISAPGGKLAYSISDKTDQAGDA